MLYYCGLWDIVTITYTNKLFYEAETVNNCDVNKPSLHLCQPKF
jgi:hypothetical protein